MSFLHVGPGAVPGDEELLGSHSKNGEGFFLNYFVWRISMLQTEEEGQPAGRPSPVYAPSAPTSIWQASDLVDEVEEHARASAGQDLQCRLVIGLQLGQVAVCLYGVGLDLL